MPDTPNEPAPTGDPAPADGGGKTFDEKYVKELRDEAKATRLALKEQKDAHGKLADELKTIKEAEEAQKKALAVALGITEAEAEDPNATMIARLEALEATNTAITETARVATEKAKVVAIETAIQTAALEKGLANGILPSHVLGLVDRSVITYDADANEVGGVKEALTSLEKTAGFLWNVENAKVGISTPGGGTHPGGPRAPEKETTMGGRLLAAEAAASEQASGFNPLLPPQSPRVGSDNLGLPG